MAFASKRARRHSIPCRRSRTASYLRPHASIETCRQRWSMACVSLTSWQKLCWMRVWVNACRARTFPSASSAAPSGSRGTLLGPPSGLGGAAAGRAELALTLELGLQEEREELQLDGDSREAAGGAGGTGGMWRLSRSSAR